MEKYDEQYAEAYGLRYKDYTDFHWKPYYPNNMVGNGLEGYDCIVVTDIGSRRVYSIRFQHKTSVTGLIERGTGPELYILFENFGFIYACPTLDFAKQRAYTGYAHVCGYVKSHLMPRENEPLLIKEADITGTWYREGDWYVGGGKRGTVLVTFLPVKTGEINDLMVVTKGKVQWRIEDNVLHTWNEGGYILSYCNAVALENDTLKIGEHVYFRKEGAI